MAYITPRVATDNQPLKLDLRCDILGLRLRIGRLARRSAGHCLLRYLFSRQKILRLLRSLDTALCRPARLSRTQDISPSRFSLLNQTSGTFTEGSPTTTTFPIQLPDDRQAPFAMDFQLMHSALYFRGISHAQARLRPNIGLSSQMKFRACSMWWCPACS